MIQVPPQLKDGMTTLKQKDCGPDTDGPVIAADTWDLEGDLSVGHETEQDETMEEDEADNQLEPAHQVTTAQLAGRRLTAASRFTNQVCDQIDLNNH